MQSTVLLPLDQFASDRVLQPVVSFLEDRKKVSLVLFHVIALPRTAPLDEELFQKEINLAREWLGKLETWCIEKGFRTRVKIRLARNVADRILDEVERHHYGLVILPKRPKKRIWGKIKKTTTQRIIQESVAPVVVFPEVQEAKDQ